MRPVPYHSLPSLHCSYKIEIKDKKIKIATNVYLEQKNLCLSAAELRQLWQSYSRLVFPLPGLYLPYPRNLMITAGSSGNTVLTMNMHARRAWPFSHHLSPQCVVHRGVDSHRPILAILSVFKMPGWE